MVEVQPDILARLPHQPPFRFISWLEQFNAGESGRAVWVVTGEEDFLKGHFPQRPLVPGVLIGEALAQLAGVVGLAADESTVPVEGRLAQIDLRFLAAVTPPAEVVLHVTVTRALGGLCQCEVRAEVDDAVIARGTLVVAAGEGGKS